jgi:sec-independent protein translocase protein TatB
MSLGEILLVLGVAVVALGPKQLPVMARYCGKLMGILHQTRHRFTQEWESVIQLKQLEDNLKKASQVDKLYKENE